ncbi:MAG: Na/Pi cotransporter family protein [Alkalilacustris sp.]
MNQGILILLGGIGLFLFGMHTMTAALRELAGPRMRDLLSRFTRTPLSGALTGAATTATIQSSSATLIMTVGFVGAGLLSFTQALGVIYGASVGTTFTGWIVLLVGLRLQLGTIALGLLFTASLMALLGKGAWGQAGRGLAGFALIFLGIDLMQEAMAGYQGQVTPDNFPAATWGGRLLLVGIGVAITVVTQSSSAGVAGALVLLAGGAVSFEQAAAMVIGMHVGTSTTSAMAAVGGTRAVLQTAVANVIYHAAGGVVGLVLIDVFGAALRAGVTGGDAQLTLVLFHTGFNIVALLLALPLTRPFAAMIRWMVPDPEDVTPASRLDERLLEDTDAALDVAGSVLRDISAELFAALAGALREGAPPAPLVAATARAQGDLQAAQEFMARIRVAEGREAQLDRLNGQLHQLDHLRRLAYRTGQAARLRGVVRSAPLARSVTALRGCLERYGRDGYAALAQRLARLEGRLARREGRARHATLRHPPHVMGLTVAEVVQLTDALRWMRRTTNHVQRILYYQGLVIEPAPHDAPPAGAPPTAPEEAAVG